MFDLDTAALLDDWRRIRDKHELPTGEKIPATPISSSARPTCRSIRRLAGSPRDCRPRRGRCEFVQTQFCMDAGVVRRYMARLPNSA